MSEEKEAIQKLYKWHDSFAASPPDTPMQAVDGIIHSWQSWRDKVTELESRIEKCRDYAQRQDVYDKPEYEIYIQGLCDASQRMMGILDGKA